MIKTSIINTKETENILHVTQDSDDGGLMTTMDKMETEIEVVKKIVKNPS